MAGSPSDCLRTERELRTMATELRRVGARTARVGEIPGWLGVASAASALQATESGRSLEDLSHRAGGLGHAVGELGRALALVEERLQGALSLAVASGLVVDGDGFWATDDDPAARAVAAARDLEDRAHSALRGALPRLDGEGFFSGLGTALSPCLSGHDGWETAAWAVGVPGTVAGLPGTWVTSHLDGMTTAATHSTDPRIRRVATAIERVGALAEAPAAKRTMTGLGVVGDVFEVGFDARERWRADGDDPTMDNRERMARAAVQGAVEGGCTIGGATFGAALLSPIPGGSFVGGAVGGWAGHKFGGWAADHAVEHVDEALEAYDAAADAVSDAADEARKTVTDASDAVGDAAGRVADKVCFWN